MTDLNLPLLDAYTPTSFQERGVAVPFTTPRLAGARIRRPERSGTEFIVPNPSGGRGVYVLHWGALRQLCRPTVHDTLLHQRIARLAVIDPAGVRLAARRLAADGFAGRDAAQAAAAAGEADQKGRVLLNFLLLISLMEQVEPSGLPIAADTERTPELDQRARQVIGRFARSIGLDAAEVAVALEDLSARLLAIGLPGVMPDARLPRLTARLGETAQGMTDWARMHSKDKSAGLVTFLARAARQAEVSGAAAIQAVQGMTSDLPALIQAWRRQPDTVAALIARPEWILDGWDRFRLAWDSAAGRPVPRDLIRLLPVPPREAAGPEPAEDDGDRRSGSREPWLDEVWHEDPDLFGQAARIERQHALLIT